MRTDTTSTVTTFYEQLNTETWRCFVGNPDREPSLFLFSAVHSNFSVLTSVCNSFQLEFFCECFIFGNFTRFFIIFPLMQIQCDIKLWSIVWFIHVSIKTHFELSRGGNPWMVQQNAHYIQNCSQLPEGRIKLQPTGICVLQSHPLSSRQSGPAQYFSTEFPTYCIHFTFFPS